METFKQNNSKCAFLWIFEKIRNSTCDWILGNEWNCSNAYTLPVDLYAFLTRLWECEEYTT
jgi:hypothetical protein